MYFIPPPTAKLKYLHGVLRGQLPPIKNGPMTLWLAHFTLTLKSPPNLHALPSPINIATIITQSTKFLSTAISPAKPAYQSIYCTIANFGPPSTASIANPMFTTAFDTYFTPRSPGA